MTVNLGLGPRMHTCARSYPGKEKNYEKKPVMLCPMSWLSSPRDSGPDGDLLKTRVLGTERNRGKRRADVDPWMKKRPTIAYITLSRS